MRLPLPILLLLVFLPLLARAAEPETAAGSAEETITQQELALVKAAEAARIGVIDKVYGCVVAVYGNDRAGGGSGVLFDPAGYALTNHHVVAAAGVEGWGGLADGELYRWKLIGTDPGGDIAIIKLAGKKRFPFAPLGDSDTVRLGDFAMAMGNPFTLAEDQTPTVTLGIVSGVQRYQEGAGLNTLVYGNCIQVDSSINPGNSGGPLFNMRGEVIGINGRGSFEERGRVNVGLGYAVSINQIKRFLPDLMATKLAQHGTLDAIFGNRQAGVICTSINLDAPIAKAGLQLGDRLLSFEGREVTDANAFTNMISTLPAEWPVELVFEHDGERRTAHVRLLALPYNLPQQQKPKPEEPKKEAPKGDQPEGDKQPKDAEDKPAEDDATDGRVIEIQQGGPTANDGVPGQIRDAELNRTIAAELVGAWRKSVVGDLPHADARQGWEIVDRLQREGGPAGKQVIRLDDQGRFRIEQTVGDERSLFGFDGRRYWRRQADRAVEVLPTDKALLVHEIAPLAALAQVFRQQPLADFGQTALHGGDKAHGQTAYRLKTLDDGGDWFYLWLRVEPGVDHAVVTLLKCGPSLDAAAPDAATVFDDWRLVDGIRWPHRRVLVNGLSETPLATITTESARAYEPSDDDFRLPSEEE
ncbi:MAG: trypsin-like peptidase domain-containing protein [Pirellulaceae bacterium]